VPTLALILDTNVVLDWLVFNDPLLANFIHFVRAGQINVLTHSTALDELRRVLNYPTLKLDTIRQEEIYASYQSLCSEAVVPMGFTAQNLFMPAGFPQCHDRDDQLFLGLTLHAQAYALVSKDKAVLALRKRTRKFGVTILDVKQLQEKMAD
jgi:uncharacterized protein